MARLQKVRTPLNVAYEINVPSILRGCTFRSVGVKGTGVTIEITKKALNDLLVQVMRIQKSYAHEQVGVKNGRREEIKKVVNRVASELEKNGN